MYCFIFIFFEFLDRNNVKYKENCIWRPVQNTSNLQHFPLSCNRIMMRWIFCTKITTGVVTFVKYYGVPKRWSQCNGTIFQQEFLQKRVPLLIDAPWAFRKWFCSLSISTLRFQIRKVARFTFLLYVLSVVTY